MPYMIRKRNKLVDDGYMYLQHVGESPLTFRIYYTEHKHEAMTFRTRQAARDYKNSDATPPRLGRVVSL